MSCVFINIIFEIVHLEETNKHDTNNLLVHAPSDYHQEALFSSNSITGAITQRQKGN